MVPHVTRRQQSRIKQMLADRGRDGCFTGCLIWLARRIYMCTPNLFRHLKARGNATVIWVANEEDDFYELKQHYGDSLDGLMTDYPTILANWANNYQVESDGRNLL